MTDDDSRDDAQLPLGLVGGGSDLPTGLRPMRPRPAALPFDSAAHVFEPSWQGRRALAFVRSSGGGPRGPAGGPAPPGPPELRLLDARGRDLTACFPELADLPACLTGTPLVLDGEIIVPDASGMPDPVALARRCRGQRDDGPPAVYLVFDLLYLRGRPLLAEPLVRRLERLDRVLQPSAVVLRVPAIAGDGRGLYRAALAQGLPAIWARRRDSPYLAGQRSSLWRSVAVTVQPASEAPASQPGGTAEPPVSTTRTTDHPSPLFALISRLPFDRE